MHETYQRLLCNAQVKHCRDFLLNSRNSANAATSDRSAADDDLQYEMPVSSGNEIPEANSRLVPDYMDLGNRETVENLFTSFSGGKDGTDSGNTQKDSDEVLEDNSNEEFELDHQEFIRCYSSSSCLPSSSKFFENSHKKNSSNL